MENDIFENIMRERTIEVSAMQKDVKREKKKRKEGKREQKITGKNTKT